MEANGKSYLLQRVIGAIVLMAAAATIIPLVLDGRGAHRSREQVEIPEEPTFEVRLNDNRQPEVRFLQAKGAIERVEKESKAAVAAASTDGAAKGNEAGAGQAKSNDTAQAKPNEAAPAISSPSQQAATTANPASKTAGAVASAATAANVAQSPATAGNPATATSAQAPNNAPAQIASAKAQPLAQPNPAAMAAKPSPANGPKDIEDVIKKVTQEQAQPARPAASTPARDVAEAWTIQMGAFKDRINAEKIVAQLNAKGYRAYLGTQTPGVFRVFVGPEIRRERADQLRDRVAADTGNRGVVVRYLP